MSLGDMVTLLREGILEVLLLAGPLLFVALAVGLVIAILQAATQIQEQTLTFVPKIFAIMITLAALGGWMFTMLGNYTIRLFRMIPTVAG
jgi:flagellar biosynthetic protein FliQ